MFIHKMFDIGNIIPRESFDNNGLFGGWNARLLQWEYPPKFQSYEECQSFINSEKEKTILYLWKELENIPFDEDSDGELILAEKWYLFDKGTTRTEIWHWFDEYCSKGVYHLLYELED